MTDTAKAPERIWMTAEDHGASWTGAFRSFRCSDLDHSNDDGPNPDYPEYVLATHCDELVAAAYLDAAKRVEKCWWGHHWILDGESVGPLELSMDISWRTPENAAAALAARDERLKAEGAKEAQAKIARLTEALKPFSDMAGEMFARNWDDSGPVIALDNPEQINRVYVTDFFAARKAIAGDTP